MSNNCPMATTLMEKAGYFLLMLLLLGVWALCMWILVNFLMDLVSLVNFLLEIAQLG